MNFLLFGATGTLGQGVRRECLVDPGVIQVQTMGRTLTGVQHAKLRELVPNDLWHYGSLGAQLSGFDACVFLSRCDLFRDD